MPFVGYPLPETFTNATPARDVHAAAHNGTNQAVNELQDEVTGLVTGDAFDLYGTNSPEGVVTAPVGTTYKRTDGGTNTAFYLKETGGAGNTGWVASSRSADALTDGTTNKAFLATERTKLTGVATSATANDTDANLKARANHTGTQLAATISDFTAAVGLAIPVAPSSEVFYSQVTADQTGIVIDTLNIDLLTGLSGTIPNIAVPVDIFAVIAVSHSAANAVINPVWCKTSPAPGTILDSLAMGFQCLTTIGSSGNAFVMARIPPNTPCTVQLYLSGTSGTAALKAQTYAPSKVWGVTV